MTHSNQFVQFMADTYEADELREIAEHGCASGCAGGMIYYSETIALFDKYRDDLFEIMENWQEETGEAPNIKLTDGFTSFANAVVWFCTEVTAYEMTQGDE